MKLSKLTLILNIIILFLYGLFQWLWYAYNYFSLVELFITGIIIPISISYIFISHSISNKTKLSHYILPGIQIILISNLLGYLNWGIWSGNILKPDIKTSGLVIFILILSIVISIAIFLIYYLLDLFLKRLKLYRNMKKETNKCEHCNWNYDYKLIHNGFNDSSYAYCESCGMTALLDGWKVPNGFPFDSHGVIAETTEKYLQLCKCGGYFKHDASPRCPHCNKVLSAEFAGKLIQKNAPGASKGWRWQKSWSELYCIIIEDKIVRDNWDLSKSPNE
jgi:hypothetical protein